VDVNKVDAAVALYNASGEISGQNPSKG